MAVYPLRARTLSAGSLSSTRIVCQQYYLGYPSPGFKDGRWHTIRVELKDPALKVRARKGYTATP